MAIMATVPYPIARQPTDREPARYRLEQGPGVLFLSGFLIAAHLPRRREQSTEPGFALLARAFDGVSIGLRPTRGNENHPRCHPRVGEGPRQASRWIPAFAGMTSVGWFSTGRGHSTFFTCRLGSLSPPPGTPLHADERPRYSLDANFS
jgi:hypothetical protein